MAEAEGRTTLEEVSVDPEPLKHPLDFRAGPTMGPCANLPYAFSLKEQKTYFGT